MIRHGVEKARDSLVRALPHWKEKGEQAEKMGFRGGRVSGYCRRNFLLFIYTALLLAFFFFFTEFPHELVEETGGWNIEKSMKEN